MTLKNLVSIVFVFIILVACTKKPDGSEFVGKWQVPNMQTQEYRQSYGPVPPYEIAKNGDSFLFVYPGKRKFAATLDKDNTLHIHDPDNEVVLSYSKSSDTLIGLSMGELERVK
jgi:hypothetical protein